MGRILRAAGNRDGAIAAYESALSINPQLPTVWNNLANIFLEQNRTDDAIERYQQAILYDSEYALAYKNIGIAFQTAGRIDEAEFSWRKAISLKAGFYEAQKLLAYLLNKGGRTDEAMRTYYWWGIIQFEMRVNGVWENLDVAESMYIRAFDAGVADPVPPFRILYIPELRPEIEAPAGVAFSMAEVPELKQPPLLEGSPSIPTHRPPRIGYLSADFFNHATMHLMAGVLEAHDRSSFDFEIFSYGNTVRDKFVERLEHTKLPITNLSEVTNREAAEIVLDHKIDVLVDLKGYTAKSRLGIAALRPAPIIVNWLGYPGTIGHKRLADYIIGDPIVSPPENAEFFSERLALMPHCYQPNDRLRPLPIPLARSEVGLPETGFVFCSLNQSIKLSPQTFDIWARLVREIPGSVLWLLEPTSSDIRNNLLKELYNRGVSSFRVIFAPVCPQTHHIARLRLADLVLDTFPYNSHTTGSDALWAGIPLVTRKGTTFVSRVAASLLTTHGFPELITHSQEEYFQLALELAQNTERRMELKSRLESVRMNSPLFDTVRFTRDLENLYRAIIANHNLPSDLQAQVITV
ncbi:MAG: tetratricopeptide repeat protein [Mesorhizobium sp.]